MNVLLPAHCRTVNLDGTHRLLHMSVSDEVRGAPGQQQSNQQPAGGMGLCWGVPSTRQQHRNGRCPVQVDMLYGRKIQAVPEQVRWLESFTVRGCAASGGVLRPKQPWRAGQAAACWQQGTATCS